MPVNFEQLMQELNQASSQKTNKRVPKIICPERHGKPCILCNRARKYLTVYNKADRLFQLQHLAKLLELDISDSHITQVKSPWAAAQSKLRSDGFLPTERAYMNIVLASNPAEVLLFEAPQTVFQPLADFQTAKTTSDYIDFMHPVRGRNILIQKTGSQRTAKYDPIPRAKESRLIDMSVLQRMYDLNDIEDLLDDPNIRITRPSQFEDNSTTEIRVLPNWLLLVCRKNPVDWKKWEEFGYSLFLKQISWHYGIGPDAYEMYERGELKFPFENNNPSVKINKTGEEDIPMFRGPSSMTASQIIEASKLDQQLKETKTEHKTDEVKETIDGSLSDLFPETPPQEQTSDILGENPLEDVCFGSYEEGLFICQECGKADLCKEKSQGA